MKKVIKTCMERTDVKIREAVVADAPLVGRVVLMAVRLLMPTVRPWASVSMLLGIGTSAAVLSCAVAVFSSNAIAAAAVHSSRFISLY